MNKERRGKKVEGSVGGTGFGEDERKKSIGGGVAVEEGREKALPPFEEVGEVESGPKFL